MSDSIETRERKIDLFKANLWGIVFMFLLIPIYGLPFMGIWHDQANWKQMAQSPINSNDGTLVSGPLIVLLVIIVGIVVHELIHGVTWAIYCKNGWRSISFGVMWKALAPYCHCHEAMPNKHYLKAVLMPGIVLGFLPAIVALAIGSLGLLAFAWLFTVAAIGDLLMARMLLQEDPDVVVKDMDSEAGFWVYDTDQGH